MADQWRPCAIVPVYNHQLAVAAVMAGLRKAGLPVILVDDGSEPECAAVLSALEQDDEQVQLVTLPQNRGKGGAVKAGLRFALDQGFSHALQVDADGQHSLTDIDRFLSLGREQSAALISGLPIYDEAIPKSRYYGRYITHFWVMVNTLSREIRDSMCGFRLYPLAATVNLIDTENTGDRMDFDTEILVRWAWRGGKVLHIPTRVSYPMDGVSHFQMWRDNLLISKMHSRLFFGMLWRFPRLLLRPFVRAS
ncbi:glycosyltransferase family 2 protein [Proteobacteria bacterium 005FR1]|nr:glycosyltransferase family 2 protein [Proteobacteria bacterium 005FR1]